MGNKQLIESKKAEGMEGKLSNATRMRLQREAKMAKKDYDQQVKKNGVINDGFICLPDPENQLEWYYIVYNMDVKEYQGGFYLGKITCPPEYPAKAPNIKMITENGRFQCHGSICLSISDMHPEQWNPVWKVNQIVNGLVSFWQQTGEHTAGAFYPGDIKRRFCRQNETETDYRIKLAKKSRQEVLKHEKFHI